MIWPQILGLVGTLGIGGFGTYHHSRCPRFGRKHAIFWAACSGIMLAAFTAQLIASAASS